MHGQVTLKFGIRTANDMHYVMYDEFDIHFEADIAIDQEVLVGNIHSLEVMMAEHTKQKRHAPVYDTMDTTREQYSMLWQRIQILEERIQAVANKVLSKGVPLPYWNLSFLTQFTFHPHALLVVMDIFYNNIEALQK